MKQLIHRFLIASLICAFSISCLHGQETAEKPKAAEQKPTLKPRVKMETSLGDIIIELDAEKAPITVLNFLQYAKEGFFKDTIFHRVMKNFMIQGGQFDVKVDKKEKGIHKGIPNEWENGLKNKRGTISMARQGGQPDSATAQFFFNVVDNASLDRPQQDGAAYAVFGKVVKGIEVVDKIRFTTVTQHPKYPSGAVTPVEPVLILSVTLLDKFDQPVADARAKIQRKALAEVAAKRAAKSIEAKEKALEEMRKAAGEKQQKLIEYIAKKEAEHGKKFEKFPSGLQFLSTKEGTGRSPGLNETIVMHYHGTLTDGEVFDSSVDKGHPLDSLRIDEFIAGWQEGVPKMKVGGKAILICPPNIAYGANPRHPYARETLIFEVELLGIK